MGKEKMSETRLFEERIVAAGVAVATGVPLDKLAAEIPDKTPGLRGGKGG